MRVEDLAKLAESLIKREDVKRAVLGILRNPRLTVSSREPLITLEESPAAPRKHHMFPGGLLLHTYSVTVLAAAIARVMREVYGVQIDEDLVVAAAILHDLYKYYQYERDEAGGGYKPRDDWYLSHDYALVAELAARNAPEDLIRVATEVHGVAPITTFEGLVVHLADSADARIGEFIQNMILARAKQLEASGCNTAAVLIEAVRALGLKTVVAQLGDRVRLVETLKTFCGGKPSTEQKQA